MTHKDERGLAVGIVIFIGMIVVGALFYTLANPAVGQIVTTSLAQTSNSDATTVINERNTIWGFVLFWVLLVSGLFIIGRSVFESGRGF